MNGIPGLRIPETSATRYVIIEPTGSKRLFMEKVMTLAERLGTIPARGRQAHTAGQARDHAPRHG
jgi:hypothetical protein